MQISGYCYPIEYEPKSEIYFLRTLACWGWATWSRAWQLYTTDSTYLLQQVTKTDKIKSGFNLDDQANYLLQLKLNYWGELNTWAVKWYATIFLRQGLCLFPKKSLVRNIGHDGSGENCEPNILFNTSTQAYVSLNEDFINEPIIENYEARQSLISYYRDVYNYKVSDKPKIGVLNKLFRRIFNLIKKVLYRLAYSIIPELYEFSKLKALNSSTRHNSYIDDKAVLYPNYRIINSFIGSYTYVSINSIINNATIGKFCSIGPNLICGWGVHPLNSISTSPMFYSTAKQNGYSLTGENKIEETKPIIIGNDVFIGMNVTILDGVTIGDGAVIGAGSVVSKDIPPYAVAYGNPIKVVKYRFSDSTIKRLLETKWWDWDYNKLKKVEEDFFEVDKFLNCSITSK
ncbi:CatB-related O-acetyltransferase [Pontibacter sp. Tf4]|nr:CatB-related O-acetyltransferase [Pontibacter sp. Tf4]